MNTGKASPVTAIVGFISSRDPALTDRHSQWTESSAGGRNGLHEIPHRDAHGRESGRFVDSTYLGCSTDPAAHFLSATQTTKSDGRGRAGDIDDPSACRGGRR